MNKHLRLYAVAVAATFALTGSAHADTLGPITPNCIVGEGTKLNGVRLGARCFSLAVLDRAGAGALSPAESASMAWRAQPSPADAWHPAPVPPPDMVLRALPRWGACSVRGIQEGAPTGRWLSADRGAN